MIEYLVEGHVYGNHYISSDDPEKIQEYCETCNDNDIILASWSTAEKNGRVKGLLRFFLKYNLKKRKDLEDKFEMYCGDFDIEPEDIIPDILDDIDIDFDKIIGILEELLENNNITRSEYHLIVNIASKERDRQVAMVKYFAQFMVFTRDNFLGNIKVITLSENKPV